MEKLFAENGTVYPPSFELNTPPSRKAQTSGFKPGVRVPVDSAAGRGGSNRAEFHDNCTFSSGPPCACQASMPPAKGRTRENPFRMSSEAATAADASFGQSQ